MSSRSIHLSENPNVVTLLKLANNVQENEQCKMFVYYRRHELDLSQSFSCLVEAVNNCMYLNLAAMFKDFSFDSESSLKTGFITLTNGDDLTVQFAYVMPTDKEKQNLVRISGKLSNRSVLAGDDDLLGYLLSLSA